MRLYHGSDCAIPKPDITHSRRNLDFGKGFYTTTFKRQAESWAIRKGLRSNRPAIVSVYEFDAKAPGLKIREFTSDRDWLDFVCSCRRGGTEYKSYDLIIGSIADDKVYAAVDMYFNGLWDADRTIDALRYYQRNDQFCFVRQEAIDHCLSFIESYEVKDAHS